MKRQTGGVIGKGRSLLARGVAVIGLAAVAALEAVAAKPTSVSPANYATAPNLHTAFAQAYDALSWADKKAKVKLDGETSAWRIQAKADYRTNNVPVRLSWSGTSGSCAVTVTEAKSGRQLLSTTVSGTSVNVYDVQVGRNYQWTLKNDTSTVTNYFYTPRTLPRIVNRTNVSAQGNCRDLGGYVTANGKVVRQGMIYRNDHVVYNAFTKLEDDTGNVTNIVRKAQLYDYWNNVVGLKTEIDLRDPWYYQAENEEFQYTGSPFGPDVTFWNAQKESGYAWGYYTDALTQSACKKALKATFVKFCDANNYPIDFHCSQGRDRTGTLAFFLLGTLGVSLNDIYVDYTYTDFCDNDDTYDGSIESLYNKLVSTYPTATYPTLQDKCVAHLKALGVTAAQISNFQSIMLEDEEKPLGSEPVVETVTVAIPKLSATSGQYYDDYVQKPTIAKSNYYTIDWGTGNYIDVGTYTITLTLVNTATRVCKWSDGTTAPKELTYKITQADNYNTVYVNPTVSSWFYGEGKPSVYLPLFKYGTKACRIVYNNETIARYSDGKAAIENAVAQLAPGKYTLKFIVDKSVSYVGTSATATFRVHDPLTERPAALYEWMKFDGNTYFETGFTPNSRTTRIEATFSLLTGNETGWGLYYAGRDGDRINVFRYSKGKFYYKSGYGEKQLFADGSNPFRTDKHTIVTCGKSVKFDSQSFTADGYGSGVCSRPLWLGSAESEDAPAYGCNFKIYGFKVFSSSTATDPLHDWVPCKTTAGNVMLYDKVTKKLYPDCRSFSSTVGGSSTSLEAGVEPPTIASKTYTGATLVATVPASDDYTVTANAGGTAVGTYDVVLTLKDATKKWSDGTTGSKTLEFSITKGANAWTTSPSISKASWKVGETAGTLTPGATKWGAVTATIAANGGTPSAFTGTALPTAPGTYAITYAAPAATANYTAPSPATKTVSFTVIKQDETDPLAYGDPDTAARTYTWKGGTGPWNYTTNWTASATQCYGIPNGSFATAVFNAAAGYPSVTNVATVAEARSVGRIDVRGAGTTLRLNGGALTVTGTLGTDLVGAEFATTAAGGATLEFNGAGARFVATAGNVRHWIGCRTTDAAQGDVTVRFAVPAQGWAEAPLAATGADAKILFGANVRLAVDASAVEPPADGDTVRIPLVSATDGVRFGVSGSADPAELFAQSEIVCGEGATGEFVCSYSDEGKPLAIFVAISPRIEIREVAVPEIAAKKATGATLVADVPESDDYVVQQNDGGVEVGSYDVVLKLVDPSRTCWADDKSTGFKVLKFEITAKDPTEYGSTDKEASVYTWKTTDGLWFHTTSWDPPRETCYGIPNNGTYASAVFPASLTESYTATVGSAVSLKRATFASPVMTLKLDNCKLTAPTLVFACGNGVQDLTLDISGANGSFEGTAAGSKSIWIGTNTLSGSQTTLKLTIPKSDWLSRTTAPIRAAGDDSAIMIGENTRFVIDASALPVPTAGSSTKRYLVWANNYIRCFTYDAAGQLKKISLDRVFALSEFILPPNTHAKLEFVSEYSWEDADNTIRFVLYPGEDTGKKANAWMTTPSVTPNVWASGQHAGQLIPGATRYGEATVTIAKDGGAAEPFDDVMPSETGVYLLTYTGPAETDQFTAVQPAKQSVAFTVIEPEPEQTAPGVAAEGVPVLTGPANFETVVVMPELLRQYNRLSPQQQSDAVETAAVIGSDERLNWEAAAVNALKPVVLTWEGTSDGVVTVRVIRDNDGKVVYETRTSVRTAYFYNPEVGRNYRWTVTTSTGDATGYFYVDGELPRLMNPVAGSVRNARDLGGNAVDNGALRVRQNRLFRSEALDQYAVDGAIPYWRDTVGIRSDIDFRESDEIKTPGVSPIGADVAHYASALDQNAAMSIFYDWYAEDTARGEACRKAMAANFRQLLDEGRLPAVFHCTSGRDRTGVFAWYVKALLGVSEAELATDFYYSFVTFSSFSRLSECWLPDLVSSLRKKFSDANYPTIKSKAEAYFRWCGITDDEIAAFRRLMLELPEAKRTAAGRVRVAIPQIAAKAGNGKLQVADLVHCGYYTVTENEGGVEPDDYEVVLTLNDPDNAVWADGTPYEKRLTFTITGEQPAPSGTPTLTAPENFKTVALVGETLKTFNAKTPAEKSAALVKTAGNPDYRAELEAACTASVAPVVLAWSGTTGECTVTVVRECDGQVVMSETTRKGTAKFYNAERGRNYRWTVTCGGKSATGYFYTESDGPRWINRTVGLIDNARDLGGWEAGTDTVVRQGVLYRTAAFDEYTETGVDYWTTTLGVRCDVDLRTLGEIQGDGIAKFGGSLAASPLGANVPRYCSDSAKGVYFAGDYDDPFGTWDTAVAGRKAIWYSFLELNKDANLPAVFHCSAGRDRTGCLAFLMEGLLGVSVADASTDYYCSWAAHADWLDRTADHEKWLPAFTDALKKKYPDATYPTIREKAVAFLTWCCTTTGGTAATAADEIARFRERMIELREPKRTAGGKQPVAVPTIADKAWTGAAQVADLVHCGYYTVTENAGGTDAGTYPVVLTLKDPENAQWADGTTTAAKTLDFRIVGAPEPQRIVLAITNKTHTVAEGTTTFASGVDDNGLLEIVGASGRFVFPTGYVRNYIGCNDGEATPTGTVTVRLIAGESGWTTKNSAPIQSAGDDSRLMFCDNVVFDIDATAVGVPTYGVTNTLYLAYGTSGVSFGPTAGSDPQVFFRQASIKVADGAEAWLEMQESADNHKPMVLRIVSSVRPTVGGETVDADKVFTKAKSTKPIIYPSKPTLTGEAGAQRIVFGGKTVAVPAHYTATLTDNTVSIALNDNARPVLADGDGDTRAIGIGDAEVTLHIGNRIEGLLYSVLKANDLNGDWAELTAPAATSDFTVERKSAEAAAFYMIKVSD